MRACCRGCLGGPGSQPVFARGAAIEGGHATRASVLGFKGIMLAREHSLYAVAQADWRSLLQPKLPDMHHAVA